MSARVREAVGADGARQSLPGVKNVIAVGAGKGGVGKTTVAVNLALALAQCGSKVGIIDGDIYGPNVPIMLGMKTQLTTDGQKIVPAEKYGLQVISMGFLTGDDAPIIWRGPMLHGALQQFFREVRWIDLDYLVVDMPPGTGDVALSLSQTVPVAGAIVVTTPQQVSLADSRRAVAMYKKLNIPPLGIIENMSYFVCRDCGHEADIFGHGGGEQMATELGVPFLGRIPIYQPIREGSDTGVPLIISEPDSPAARAFMAAAERTAAQVSIASYTRPTIPLTRRAMNIPCHASTRSRTASTCCCTRITPARSSRSTSGITSARRTSGPGSTGFAHLFEHLMFEGSEHHDKRILPAAAGRGRALNGSTNADRTNYWEVVPTERARARAVDGIGSHGVPAAGADRGQVLEPARRRAERAPAELREPAVRPRADGDAGGAVSAGSSVSLDDDRRDRRPARRAARRGARVLPHLLPPGERVAGARRRHRPASERWRSCARYFEDLPAGPRVDAGAARAAALDGETRLLLEDRVELPRLYLAWLTPAMFAAGDAELDLAADMLANGKTSRLYRRLVFDERIATDVSASQNSREIGGFVQIAATAAPGPHAGRARAA